MKLFSGFGKKEGSAEASFPADLYKPVMRCSICTGEKVAGFREKETGKFIELMLIRNEADLDEFRKKYGTGEPEKEY